MRARVKRRQTVRRLEFIAIVAIIAVSLAVGLYLALSAQDPRAAVDGKPVSVNNLDDLEQAAVSSYGNPGQGYLKDVHNLTSPWSAVKPILVYVGAEYCPFCAVQRWSITLALMRFGNFTKDIHYMTSALGDGDYSTITFYNSTYHSSYITFEPFEIEDRAYNPLMTLPPNYTTAFDAQGSGDFPFLNFNDQYYISGAILDPSILGTMNQTQIIASITSLNGVGSEIKQAANVITAVICETTGNKPTSVCTNPSITADTLDSYTLPSTASGSQILLTGVTVAAYPDVYLGRDYRSWN